MRANYLYAVARWKEEPGPEEIFQEPVEAATLARKKLTQGEPGQDVQLVSILLLDQDDYRQGDQVWERSVGSTLVTQGQSLNAIMHEVHWTEHQADQAYDDQD